MRIVFWNCAMALHRKWAALTALSPDVAVIGECATPEVLTRRGVTGLEGRCQWMGRNPNKGLGVFAFNGYRLRRHAPFRPTLQHVLPVEVTGPEHCNLLAVWAMNASGGVTRKHQLGPLRRGLAAYRDFLANGPAVVGGDLNSNAIWDKPGWRINHMALVEKLAGLGLASAYHLETGEAHGAERVPTCYWRDRRKDGPTYHLDYAFVPPAALRGLAVGSFEDWVGTGLSDHVPLVVDLAPAAACALVSARDTTRR